MCCTNVCMDIYMCKDTVVNTKLSRHESRTMTVCHDGLETQPPAHLHDACNDHARKRQQMYSHAQLRVSRISELDKLKLLLSDSDVHIVSPKYLWKRVSSARLPRSQHFPLSPSVIVQQRPVTVLPTVELPRVPSASRLCHSPTATQTSCLHTKLAVLSGTLAATGNACIPSTSTAALPMEYCFASQPLSACDA